MTESIRILYVDDGPRDIELFRAALMSMTRSYNITEAQNLDELHASLRTNGFDVAVVDLDSRISTIKPALLQIQATHPDLNVVGVATPQATQRFDVEDGILSALSDVILKTPLEIGRLPQAVLAAGADVIHRRQPPSTSDPRATRQGGYVGAVPQAQRNALTQELLLSDPLVADFVGSEVAGIALLNSAGEMERLNLKLCRLLKFEPGQLVGQSLESLFARPAPGGGRADKLPCQTRHTQTLITGDGSLLAVRLLRSAENEHGLSVLVVLEEPEEIQACACFPEGREPYWALADFVNHWYWETDAEHRIVRLTEAASRVTGRPIREMLGARHWDRPDLLPVNHTWGAHIAQLEAHKAFVDHQYQCAWPDGQVRYFALSGRPVFAQDGQFIGYRGIGRNTTERRAAEQTILRLSQYDSITGLPNRALFKDRLAAAITAANGQEQSFALIVLDLDQFKMINDTLGNRLGDEVLRRAGERIQHCLGGEDLVGRLGGDEFGIIAKDISQTTNCVELCTQLLQEMKRPYVLGGEDRVLTASLGVTIYPNDGADADRLLKNADTAMHRAKELKRNNVQFFTPALNEKTRLRLQLWGEVRHAFERKEFLLHYQPKVGVRSGRISGFEALLRWAHSEKGLVAPASFIAVLEESHLILEVGDWVLHQACAQIAGLASMGLTPLPIAINLSILQIEHGGLVDSVRHAIATTGADPKYLEFEITESVLLRSDQEIVEILAALRGLGCTIAIDDFGTGYSSLAYLKSLPVDKLKIDRSFIQGIPEDIDDEAITAAIISLAHNMRLAVVAEGVETKAQFDFLAHHLCDEIQGFFASRPLPADQLPALVGAGRIQGFPPPGIRGGRHSSGA